MCEAKNVYPAPGTVEQSGKTVANEPNNTKQQPGNSGASGKIVWDRIALFFGALVRFLVLIALLLGCAKALSTLRELAQDGGGMKMNLAKQHVITEPAGATTTRVSGLLKLLLDPSTNSATAAQGADVKSADDVVFLPVERTENSPVVLPYIASLTACVIVICAFILGVVRVWCDG